MYFLEKLEFLIQNYKHDKKAIQEIVNNQDLYLESFANRVKWTELRDMTSTQDAQLPRDLALKFFNQALIIHRQKQVLSQQNIHA